jgi:diaminohydroxyphosphoribosylaminopyrimidine deaminase/5-amino-6-(5-phosphoribosylamino)uracil reductase
MQLDADKKHMQKCLELAQLAQGRTQPNPMVGSIIVDESGEIVSQGYHQKAGHAHAEVIALDRANTKAKGQTLYVNLEPCCHHGRTGPCTDKIIASGIKKVIIGMKDPNPKVAGNGIKKLQEAGLEVKVGILEDECFYLNRSFIKYITTGKPWVVLKMATTLDGRIADRYGKSQWITGQAARLFVQQLRNTHDAILVGPSTVIIDNPSLTVKELDNIIHPIRISLDPSLEIDLSMQIFKKLDGHCRLIDDHAQVVLFTSKNTLAKNKITYPKHVKIIGVEEKDSKLDLASVFNWLGKKQISSVLCEGGGKLAANLIFHKLVDEIHWLVAPKLLLDSKAMLATHLSSAIALDQSIKLKKVNYQMFDEDILLTYLISYQ